MGRDGPLPETIARTFGDADHIRAQVDSAADAPAIVKEKALHDEVKALLEDLVGIDIRGDVPLMAAGVDSIAASEVNRLLSDRIGISLPSTLLFDYPTLNHLTDYLRRA